MAHRFLVADVFTDRPFSGNQLAVFPEAEGLSDRAMQAIAREFNFAETTFVLTPRAPQHACRVRIFTPRTELPFAGHPTIGTAAALARTRSLDLPASIVLELGIGLVPVELERRGAPTHARLTMERPVEMPAVRPAREAVAAALSLAAPAVEEAWFADGGVRFCFARLADRAAVDRAVLDRAAWTRHFATAWSPNLYFYAGKHELYVRMFAPALGIEEDPATGSGAVGLAGVLAARLADADGSFTWHIEQGVAMGRPSRLEVTADKRAGRVARVRLGGVTVLPAEGGMDVPAGY